MYNTNYCISLL